MFDLRGKTALVTGSSQGIGKEIAKALASAGAMVYVHGSVMSEKLREAAKYVGTAHIAVGNLYEDNAADLLYEQTGGVDLLILNASMQLKKPWYAFTPEEFDRHITCNLKSSYFIIQKYYEHMKERKFGRIVTIGSTNQYNNHPELSIYGVTKAAQMKLVQNIAPYMAPYGITVNNIAPGAIETPRNDAALSDAAFRRKVEASIPLGYVGDAGDMNGAALLLCSEEGRYITGSEIIVDGGMHLL